MSDDVVRQIVAIAALRVEGVHALTDHITPIGQLAHHAWPGAGGAPYVHVDITGQQVTVDLALVVAHGVALPVVADGVRREVATAVSHMTQLQVTRVDVLVADIDLIVPGQQA